MKGAQWKTFLPAIREYVEQETLAVHDPAHDIGHIQRVVDWTARLSREEGARPEISTPAAWLHDIVNLPKSDSRRSRASLLSAERAQHFLGSIGYPQELLPRVAHAIEAHSFSAGITPLTIEAKVVQDADRLDALGAIGIARLFAVAGQMQSRLLDSKDPFAENRELNDRLFAVDHFAVKLQRLPETMCTEAGRAEADRRAIYLQSYLLQLKYEVTGTK